jgi:P27 family predicted phage terminase small subunit
MGKRGPAKKPTKLKVLQGTARKKDLKRKEPKPKQKAPRCPAWLPDEAKARWKQLAPQLEHMGLLTTVDGMTFSLLLMHWALAVDAAKTLKKEGLTSEDERGLPRKHPMAQILRDNSQMFKAYSAEFGLSPSSRANLDLPQKDDESDDARKFLFGG